MTALQMPQARVSATRRPPARTKRVCKRRSRMPASAQETRPEELLGIVPDEGFARASVLHRRYPLAAVGDHAGGRKHHWATVMVAPLAGNLRDVAAVLERFLCPGGKLRLSPYVESVPCSIPLGERPDPKHYAPSLCELVRKPEHRDKFDAIAQLMLEKPSAGF